MRKNALVVLLLLVSFVFVNSVFANIPSFDGASIVRKTPKITLEEARKLALKKMDGKIEDEYPLEDEGKLIVYVFKIRNAKNKVFEIQVEPEKGAIVYAEEDVYN